MLSRAEPDNGVVEHPTAALHRRAVLVRVIERAAQLLHHPAPLGSVLPTARHRGRGPSDGPRSPAPVTH
eukprot:9053480-Lingulodinium_polyedra.AAC.1